MWKKYIVKKKDSGKKCTYSGKKWTVEIIDRGKKYRDSGKKYSEKNRDGR